MQGWNKEVTEKVGISLMEGITEFFAGDYNNAVEHLAIMPWSICVVAILVTI